MINENFSIISAPYPGAKRYVIKDVLNIVYNEMYDTVIEPFCNIGILSANLLFNQLVKQAVLNDIDGVLSKYETFLDYKDWIVSEMYKAGYHRSVHTHLSNTFKSRYYLVVDEKNNILTPVPQSTLEPEGIEYLQSLFKCVDPEYYRLLAMEDCFNTATLVRKKDITYTDFNSFRNNVTTNKRRKYLRLLKRANVTIKQERYKLFLRHCKDCPRPLYIIDPTYPGIYEVNSDHVVKSQDVRWLLEFANKTDADFLFFHDDLDKLKRLCNKYINLDENTRITFVQYNNGHRIGIGQIRTAGYAFIEKNSEWKRLLTEEQQKLC